MMGKVMEQLFVLKKLTTHQNITTTKPLNQNEMKQKEYKPTRQDKSRAEMGAYGTMILLGIISISLIIHFITK